MLHPLQQGDIEQGMEEIVKDPNLHPGIETPYPPLAPDLLRSFLHGPRCGVLLQGCLNHIDGINRSHINKREEQS